METNVKTTPIKGITTHAKKDGTVLMMIFAILVDQIVVSQGLDSTKFATIIKIAKMGFIAPINVMLGEGTTCADPSLKNTAISQSAIRITNVQRENTVTKGTVQESLMQIVVEVKEFNRHKTYPKTREIQTLKNFHRTILLIRTKYTTKKLLKYQ